MAATTVLDRLYGARRSITSGRSPVETLTQIDAAIVVLTAELQSACQHVLFPVNPDDPSDDAELVCERCEVIMRPSDLDPTALAIARDRGQAEDEFTKREEVVF